MPRGASKYTPPPLPLKNACCPNGGRGGGAKYFSPECLEAIWLRFPWWPAISDRALSLRFEITASAILRSGNLWETDFYTPPVLGGAALWPFPAPAVYKNRVLRAQDFYTPLALKTAKGLHLPALEVYKNQSPKSKG